MIDYLRLMEEALALTVAIEVAVAWLFGLRKKWDLLTVVLINVITNPLLNYLILINGYFHLISRTNLLIWSLEVVVVVVEWRLLVYVLRQRQFKLGILALVMNAASYLAGLVIFVTPIVI